MTLVVNIAVKPWAYHAIEWEREHGFSILNQEHIKPAKEHATTIDCEIQTWLLDTNFSNIQYGKLKAAMCTCLPAFVGSLDTAQEYIMASILSGNHLRTVADKSERLIRVYRSSGPKNT